MPYQPWTQLENETIKEKAAALSDPELRNYLNERFDTCRKLDAVRKQRQRLGVKKRSGRGICEVIPVNNDEDSHEEASPLQSTYAGGNA